jgi:periplasmic divalent cation tolerance protein
MLSCFTFTPLRSARGGGVMPDELIVFVTVPSPEISSQIAHSLVSERLAACVNVIPGVKSVYRWEGEVTSDTELLLIIKTTDESYASLERRVKELHPYSTPEVIGFKIERGSEDYLRWLRESTTT